MPQQSHYQPHAQVNLKWRDTATALAIFLALVVMLPLRRKIGLRRLSLSALVLVAFGLYLIDSFSGLHVSLLGGVQSSGPGLLTYYALAFLGLGLWERHRRWAELRRGEYWHTFSGGVSYFEFLPLRQDRIYKNVDPAIGFLLGLCVRNLGFTALGLVLMLSAIAWRIAEEHIYQLSLKQDLDTIDGLLEARIRASVMNPATGEAGPSPAQPQSLRHTGGVPTGADAGLAEQIARRRKEATPSGLATNGAAANPSPQRETESTGVYL